MDINRPSHSNSTAHDQLYEAKKKSNTVKETFQLNALSVLKATQVVISMKIKSNYFKYSVTIPNEGRDLCSQKKRMWL